MSNKCDDGVLSIDHTHADDSGTAATISFLCVNRKHLLMDALKASAKPFEPTRGEAYA